MSRLIRRFICIFMTFIIWAMFTVKADVQESAAPFADVTETHWAYESVLRAYRDGIVTGTGENGSGGRLFSPDGELTLPEFTVMLARAFYKDEVAEKEQTNWYNRELEVLGEHGIFGKIEDLDISHKVNRYELAVMAVNVLNDQTGELILNDAMKDGVRSSVTDWEQIPEIYQDAVCQAYSRNILNGSGGGRFDGEALLTRAQAAAVYCRIADAVSAGTSTPLLLHYKSGEKYARAGDWLKTEEDEDVTQYRVDIDQQFYEPESVTLSFRKNEEHKVFVLDGDRRILDELWLWAGKYIIPMSAEIKYITVAAPTKENDITFTGVLTEKGEKELKEGRYYDNPFAGKSLSVIGDSLSAYRSYTPKYENYPDGDVAEVKQMWWYILAKNLGMSVCKINAYAGSGVSDLGEPEKTASDGRGKELDMCGQKPDAVIAMIGINDSFKSVEDETISANYLKMLDDIRETYPDAEIYLSTYPHSSMKELNELIRGLAADNGLGLIDTEGCIPDESYYIDGTHFNAAGMERLAERMTEELLK